VLKDKDSAQKKKKKIAKKEVWPHKYKEKVGRGLIGRAKI
jgi:hypothetical protein